MSQQDRDDQDQPQQLQLQKLIDMDIPDRLQPEQRLCLAVLRQAVLDYFGDNPDEKKSATEYFAASPFYQLTLQMFHLPADMLPIGVDIGRAPGAAAPPRVELIDALRLETLVHELSGTQLKVMLTLGLLELPVSAGKVSAHCRLNRATVLSALAYLAEKGLVVALDTGLYTIWTVPAQARQFLDQLWASAGWAAGDEAMLLPLPNEAPAPPEPPADSAAE